MHDSLHLLNYISIRLTQKRKQQQIGIIGQHFVGYFIHEEIFRYIRHRKLDVIKR